jgi:hypothetical protein
MFWNQEDLKELEGTDIICKRESLFTKYVCN